jgi:hypothetical protein
VVPSALPTVAFGNATATLRPARFVILAVGPGHTAKTDTSRVLRERRQSQATAGAARIHFDSKDMLVYLRTMRDNMVKYEATAGHMALLLKRLPTTSRCSSRPSTA